MSLLAMVSLQTEGMYMSQKRAEAWQQVAITARLNGSDSLAREALETAYAEAVTEFHRGQILRDLGMAKLYYRPDFALENLEESLRILGEPAVADIAGKSQQERLVEEAVSRGLLARHTLIVRRRRRDAYRQLRQAHKVLHGQRATYELDNLVWLLKASLLPMRIVRLPRAVMLARRTNAKTRLIEACITTVSPRLAEWVKRKRRARLIDARIITARAAKEI